MNGILKIIHNYQPHNFYSSTQQTIRRQIPSDCNVHTHGRKNHEYQRQCDFLPYSDRPSLTVIQSVTASIIV